MPATYKTTGISAISDSSFEDAIQQGIARATNTLRGVGGVWIKDMYVMIENGSIAGYKVNMEITFTLEGEHGEPQSASHARPTRRNPQYGTSDESFRRHILLEELTEEQLKESKMFLTLTPAKRGSGYKDVSVNHDRYLAED